MSASVGIDGFTRLRKRAPRVTVLPQYDRAKLTVSLAVSENQRRLAIIDELYRLHARLMKDAFADMSAVEALPPDPWLNQRLANLGEIWRVQSVDGFRYEIYDAT